jgi:hypothetical protein
MKKEADKLKNKNYGFDIKGSKLDGYQ